GRLEDRLAGADQALVLGILEHRASHPVLDRPGGAAGLELGPDPGSRLWTEALELDQRRVPDCLDDVAITAPAGLVLEALGHCFTKCSEGLRARKDEDREPLFRRELAVLGHGPPSAGGCS